MCSIHIDPYSRELTVFASQSLCYLKIATQNTKSTKRIYTGRLILLKGTTPCENKNISSQLELAKTKVLVSTEQIGRLSLLVVGGGRAKPRGYFQRDIPSLVTVSIPQKQMLTFFDVKSVINCLV